MKIVTPARVTEREISRIRLKDETGFFGIMKGHIDFLTALEPSVCFYRDDEGREVFLAVDGGIFRISGGIATLTSKDVFESDDAGKLSEIIEKTFSMRDASELALLEMIKGIEKSFMEKTLEIMRGK